jgi:hypothetical protein
MIVQSFKHIFYDRRLSYELYPSLHEISVHRHGQIDLYIMVMKMQCSIKTDVPEMSDEIQIL